MQNDDALYLSVHLPFVEGFNFFFFKFMNLSGKSSICAIKANARSYSSQQLGTGENSQIVATVLELLHQRAMPDGPTYLQDYKSSLYSMSRALCHPFSEGWLFVHWAYGGVQRQKHRFDVDNGIFICWTWVWPMKTLRLWL